MHVLLLLVPLFAAVGAAQRPTPATESDPAYREVSDAYKLDLQVYDQARLDAARGKGERPTQHPAIRFWPRMEDAASRGSARARQWMCENLVDGVSDPALRLGVLEAQIQALLTCCAGDTTLIVVPRILRVQAATFGVDTSMRHLDSIATTATNPEVQARALLETALLTADYGKSADPARRARATEIETTVVTAFPTTKAARDAAELMLVALQSDFCSGMTDWLTTAESALAAGPRPTELPVSPVVTLQPRFEVLAHTGLPTAKSWVEDLYPRFLQLSKLAPDLALSGLARDLGRHYSVRHPQWGSIRMRLFGLALRLHGGEPPWLRSVIGLVDSEAPALAALAPLPFTAAVLDLARGSEARSMALWIEAGTRISEGSEAEFERALVALDAIVERHADMSGLVPKARDLAARVRAVMPGSPLPDSRAAEWALKDIDDLEVVLSGYRGKVLLIDVFEMSDEGTPGKVPARRALIDGLAGKPFELVGLCTSRSALANARKTFGELGITWRVGLLQTMSHPYLDTLFARRRPTACLLVDADGVIRARNRPFAEMAALAVELTAAREQALKR